MAKRDPPERPALQLGAAWPRPSKGGARPAITKKARSSKAIKLPSARSNYSPAIKSSADSDSASQVAARRAALIALNEDRVPFVVAGAYAMREYTSIRRDTKDLDIFCRRKDAGRALTSLARVGFRVEMTDSLWLAKGFAENGEFVDVIFSSGNGVAEVDELWLRRARKARVLGVDSLIAPPEEMIWSKSYVQERERYDGADIQHLLLWCAESLDWKLLLDRMRPHPEVLLAHLLLFRFSYPGDRDKIPAWVLDELIALSRRPALPSEKRLCRGTLLSGRQYEIDLAEGYRDARPLEVPAWREHREPP
ncbi:MAG: hypothetical protein ACOX6T_01615 [Myxococcales bacterium]